MSMYMSVNVSMKESCGLEKARRKDCAGKEGEWTDGPTNNKAEPPRGNLRDLILHSKYLANVYTRAHPSVRAGEGSGWEEAAQGQ